MSAYLQQHDSCLLCDYVEAERKSGERVVCENQHFTAVAPFWAVWPFELMVVAQPPPRVRPAELEAEITALVMGYLTVPRRPAPRVRRAAA